MVVLYIPHVAEDLLKQRVCNESHDLYMFGLWWYVGPYSSYFIARTVVKNKNNSGRNSLLSDRTCKLTLGCTSTFSETGEDNPASSGLTFSQPAESQAAVGFPDRNYRYKSGATEITHYADLALTPYTGQKSLPQGNLSSTAFHITNPNSTPWTPWPRAIIHLNI